MGQTAKKRITRLAPSPTGALHLGNLRTFLVNWAIARQQGWEIAFRIDDLDSPRIKPGADLHSIEILQWIGLNWDGRELYENQLQDKYHSALIKLAAAGQIYPCRCTRLQIQQRAASAPHADQHELRYPGTCRPLGEREINFDDPQYDGAAWRFWVDPGFVEFVDEFSGPQQFSVDQNVGDFLIGNRQRQPVYQLAVVVDDHQQQVTDIVRGDDLLSSTPRQILLQRALNLPGCRYWHLPMVIGSDGHRLAKRHGDTRVAWYREQGVTANRLIGLMAAWCGAETRQSMSLAEFLQWFRCDSIPRHPIVFSDDDHVWLLAEVSP